MLSLICFRHNLCRAAGIIFKCNIMPNVIENHQKQQVEEAQSRICVKDGFLPIPIAIISPARMDDVTLYCLDASGNVVIYPDRCTQYNKNHKDFLLKKGVRYLYVSTSDYNKYLRAVCFDAHEIVTCQDLPLVEKCELTYSILYALAMRIMNEDINRMTFVETLKICKRLMPLFIKNSNTYRIFFPIMLREYDHAAHAANMTVTLVTFARKIGICDEKILIHCCCGGILHDLGKRFVPTDIIDSEDKLSELDWQIVQNHVLEGIKKIDKFSKLPSKVMNIINEHHETIDGEGYPKGLKGKEISFYGRMACIVDMFEAMTCERPYRNSAMTTEQALKEIRGIVGLKLDKNIAGSFAQFIDDQITGLPVSDDYYDGLILDDLGLTPEIGANPSGRRHQRYYFRTKARLTRLSRKEDKWVLFEPKYMFCSNMSLSGIALIYDKSYDTNQMVSIELEMPEEYEEKVNAIGKIVRCVDNGGGNFTIGIEFIKYMDESKVKHIYNTLK